MFDEIHKTTFSCSGCSCSVCDDIRFKFHLLLWFKRVYRGLTGGFLLLQNFSVVISVSPHDCFILVLILISVFLR